MSDCAHSFEFEGGDYRCNAGESLLDALLRQGAELPHSCRRGSCHTCVLKVESGAVEVSRRIDAALAADAYTLACIARPAGPSLRVRRARAGEIGFDAELVHRRQLTEDIFALDIAPARALDFRAGQFLRVECVDGVVRPYSIASRAGDDFFLSIHVRRISGGRASGWLCEQLQPGATLRLQGPFGGCCFDASMQERPLQLLATGTGAGALAALAREALEEGHAAGITLYHGVRRAQDLYLHDHLLALQQRFASFRYVPCVSGRERSDGGVEGRATERAFAGAGMPSDAELFLCGLPRMVEEARFRARLAGIPVQRIHADPFDFAHPALPRDAEKIADLATDDELWAALQHGPGLTRILESFYQRVYADPRLSPFFGGVPLQRAVQKQYEFLASVFSGATEYLGMNPFNAHHWMVISDELFDYREAMFERVLREHGLASHLIDRWLALHELFRAEIVKPAGRGLVSQGVEQPLRSHSVERLDVDTLCDGCGAEIAAGQPSRYQFRIGDLHCAACAGIPVDAETA
jgi:ferredoxin-NADP reductase/ferredoxin/truncated hemoglobin YjbI